MKRSAVILLLLFAAMGVNAQDPQFEVNLEGFSAFGSARVPTSAYWAAAQV